MSKHRQHQPDDSRTFPGSAARGIAPVERSARIVDLDIIRGFALFGIVLVTWSGPNLGAFAVSPNSGLDRVLQLFIESWCHNKFYPLFSILFGIGMSLQMQRMARRGGVFADYFVRRLIVLFGIGTVHHVLLWTGDVLHIYAICGVVLLIARGWSNRALVAAGIGLLLVPGLAPWIPNWVLEPVPRSATGLLTSVFHESDHPFGYWSLVAARAGDFLARKPYILNYLPHADIAGLFLLGAVVGRRIFLDPQAQLSASFRRCVFAFGVLGVLGQMWDFIGRRLPSPLGGESAWIADFVTLWNSEFVRLPVRSWARPLLAMSYAGVVVLLLRSSRGRIFLSPLASIGRMALTNYVLMSMAGVLLFFNQGFAQYGKLPMTQGVAAVVVFFLLEVVVSTFWLKWFQFGPMEWLWRSLTYGCWQPLRLGGAIPADEGANRGGRRIWN